MTTTTTTTESQRNLEPISQLADGELPRREAEFLVRRFSRDVEACAAWQRMHLVRDCLRREFTGPVSLVDRVSAALIEEPEMMTRPGSRWMRLGVGSAMAAGVAMLAIVGLSDRMSIETGPTPDGPQAGFVSQSSPLDRQFNAQAVPVSFGAGNSSPVPRNAERVSSQQLINRYVIRHQQVAGGAGFVSFTPVLTPPAQIEAQPAEREREPQREPQQERLER
ncbi:MAG: sigma-E factor negative regulatory protein [Wenzhouxiangellaceae bacterium]